MPEDKDRSSRFVERKSEKLIKVKLPKPKKLKGK